MKIKILLGGLALAILILPAYCFGNANASSSASASAYGGEASASANSSASVTPDYENEYRPTEYNQYEQNYYQPVMNVLPFYMQRYPQMFPYQPQYPFHPTYQPQPMFTQSQPTAPQGGHDIGPYYTHAVGTNEQIGPYYTYASGN